MNSKLVNKILWLASMGIVAVGVAMLLFTARPYFSEAFQKIVGTVKFNADPSRTTVEYINSENKEEAEVEEVQKIVTAEEAKNTLSIPTIGLKDVPVIYPKTNDYEAIEEALLGGVVHLSNSSNPSEDSGATYVIGHSSNFSWVKGDYNYVFKDLSSLEVGNTIRMRYGRVKYDYVVTEKKFLTFEEAIDLQFDPAKKVLVVMTCWPANSSRARVAIIAETKAKQAL